MNGLCVEGLSALKTQKNKRLFFPLVFQKKHSCPPTEEQPQVLYGLLQSANDTYGSRVQKEASTKTLLLV